MGGRAASTPVANALSALTLVAACSSAQPSTGCPAGSAGDEPRAARLAALLQHDTGVAARLTRVHPTLCFGSEVPGAGGVVLDAPGRADGAVERPVVLLDASGSDAALAARLAHLVRHAEEPPFEPGAAGGLVSCALAMARAARLEAVAAREEELLRTRLGLGPGPHGEDVVRAYLQRCRDPR